MVRKHNQISACFLYFGIPTFVYIVFILGGFSFVFMESLGYIKALGMTSFSFEYYLAVLTDSSFIKSCLFSLYLATTSAILSTIIGIYLAQLIVFSENKIIHKYILKLSNIFIILPYLFSIFLVIWIFSNTGLLSRVLYLFGFEGNLGILYDNLGLGMIFTFVLKGCAFVTVYVYNVMSKIKKDYYILAQSMGVPKSKIITSIYIPLCKNVIVWSSTILFAYTLGSYEVPMLLANIKQPTLATTLYSYYTSWDIADYPKSMAINIILLLINLVFGCIYAFAVNKIIRWRK